LADKGMTLAIVLLVAGLIVGGGIGYFAAPSKTVTVGTTTVQTVTALPLKGQTIKLGYIASSTTSLETGKYLMESMCFPDLNKQMQALNWGAPTFTDLLEDATGQDNVHLEKVQGFLSLGDTVFQGGGWSSQAQASLSYCNSNNMLMWSSSSTSPTLAIANDYLYRMCPADSALAPALVDMMWGYGIKSVIVFQRGDSWGDGIVNLFTPAWTAKGGNFAGTTIRYATEATDFSNYLQQANTAATAAIAANGGNPERVGTLLLSFDEFPVIASQAKDYADFYKCPCFGGDGTAVSQRGMDDAPDQVNHLRCFSMMAQSPESSQFDALAAKYTALTKQQFTAYSAYAYDIEFISAYSQIQAQSIAGKDVLSLQTPISDTTWGSGGWCQLNEYGDRAPPPFNVWYYAPSATKASFSYIAGVYNPDTKVMTWDSAGMMANLKYNIAGP